MVVLGGGGAFSCDRGTHVHRWNEHAAEVDLHTDSQLSRQVIVRCPTSEQRGSTLKDFDNLKDRARIWP